MHGDLLGERARLTPERTALVFVPTGERFTYAELDARAARVAASWHGRSVSPGATGSACSPQPAGVPRLLFRRRKSGIVVVPLGTRLTAHELEHIVRDSGCGC